MTLSRGSLTLDNGVVTASVKEQPSFHSVPHSVVLNGYVVAAPRGDNAVVSVTPHLVVVDVQVVAVVMWIKSILDVVIHLVSSPITLLMAWRIHKVACIVAVEMSEIRLENITLGERRSERPIGETYAPSDRRPAQELFLKMFPN